MFGGVGKLVLILVLRVWQARHRREGFGLSPRRRLVLPLGMVVLGLIGIPAATGSVAAGSPGTLGLVAGIAVLGGVVRAACTRLAPTATGSEVEGPVTARDRGSALLVEALVTVLLGILLLHTFLSFVGLHAAVSVWAISIALFEISAYAATVVRAGGLQGRAVAGIR